MVIVGQLVRRWRWHAFADIYLFVFSLLSLETHGHSRGREWGGMSYRAQASTIPGQYLMVTHVWDVHPQPPLLFTGVCTSPASDHLHGVLCIVSK